MKQVVSVEYRGQVRKFEIETDLGNPMEQVYAMARKEVIAIAGEWFFYSFPNQGFLEEQVLEKAQEQMAQLSYYVAKEDVRH